MNIVDSSGWIEYLLDTDRADLFAQPIEQRATLLVPVIALFEVHKALSRKVPSAAVTQCLDVMRLGRVLEITDRRAVAAAEVSSKHRLAMADAKENRGRKPGTDHGFLPSDSGSVSNRNCPTRCQAKPGTSSRTCAFAAKMRPCYLLRQPTNR